MPRMLSAYYRMPQRDRVVIQGARCVPLTCTRCGARALGLIPTHTLAYVPMSTAGDNNEALLSALDQLFAKYFKEEDGPGQEKTPQDKFWATYLRVMKDDDEARPKDWDGNTGSILTFVCPLFLYL